MRQRVRKLKDYAGQRFGRLLALQMVERDWSARNDHVWLFRCDCGNEVQKRLKSVRDSGTKSCGCIKREQTVERNTTHGLSRVHPKTYRTWKDMRARCNNPKNTEFENYGGRGITVCAEWDDFSAFLNHVGPRPEGLTLDRIDVNGNYEPGNVRWATSEVQANNKRTNHVIEYLGTTKTLQQWCDLFGLEPSKVRYRLKQNMPLDLVFNHEDMRHGQ